jgi:hypothetical protein
MSEEYRRVRVLIETAERSFRRFLYKPEREEAFRLSDHLNTYDKTFLCLTEVEITNRGEHWRVGEKQDFAAVSVAAITYVTPLESDA